MSWQPPRTHYVPTPTPGDKALARAIEWHRSIDWSNVKPPELPPLPEPTTMTASSIARPRPPTAKTITAFLRNRDRDADDPAERRRAVAEVADPVTCTRR
jgi:hypothetical protein